jgi:hypothetical protein
MRDPAEIDVILKWPDGSEDHDATLADVLAFRALYGKPSYSWRYA